MFYNRLGTDLEIEWPITIEGADDISDLDLTLYVICKRFRKELPFTIEDNTLKFTFYGIDQTVCGKYTLQLIMNESEQGQVICDHKKAFTLYK